MIIIGHSRAAAATGGITIAASGTADIPVGAGPRTINLPGAPESGDYALLFYGRDSAIAESVVGYDVLVSPGGSPGVKVFGKFLASGETTVVVPGDSVTPGALAMYILAGVNPATQLDVAPAMEVSTDPPSITTVTDGAMVFAAAVQGNRSGSVAAFPSGYGNTLQEASGGAASSRLCTLGAASKIAESAGTEDPGAFTFDAGQATRSVTLAIRPV